MPTHLKSAEQNIPRPARGRSVFADEGGFVRGPKRLHCVAVPLLALSFLAWSGGRLRAESFVFSGSDAGGTASGTMDFLQSGNRLTVTLDNTSPTVLDDGSGTNSPGINAFGFNFENPIPELLSWKLEAFTKDASGNLSSFTTTIGGEDPIGTDIGTGDWELSTSSTGVTLDFLPNTQPGSTVQGSMYNPAATSGFGGAPQYFTTATLTAVFADTPALSFGGDSPFMRFQNVGLNGDGSLKLVGTSSNGGGPSPVVPEPGSFALLGMGAVALCGYRLRRRRKDQSPAAEAPTV